MGIRVHAGFDGASFGECDLVPFDLGIGEAEDGEEKSVLECLLEVGLQIDGRAGEQRRAGGGDMIGRVSEGGKRVRGM